jgi:zinc/manganese transport system substrate-binding protein
MKSLHIFVLAALIPVATLARLNVVATTADFGSIAAEIGGDRTEVTTLARPTEDPHFVDARPSFIAKLNRADVLVEGGAELEIGWLPPLLEGARNAELAAGAPGHISCSAGIAMLEVPAVLDRSRGDEHAAGNPHFMVDPLSGKIAAANICAGLCRIDPASCVMYEANLKAFNNVIDAKMLEWERKLVPYQGRHVVAYHNSWPYFARRFGLNIDLFLEPKPGIPPTPASLTAVIAKIKSGNAHVILVEPHLNRKTAEKVAAETGATIVDVSQFPGGVKGTDTYVGLIDYLVDAMAKALAGETPP